MSSEDHPIDQLNQPYPSAESHFQGVDSTPEPLNTSNGVTLSAADLANLFHTFTQMGTTMQNNQQDTAATLQTIVQHLKTPQYNPQPLPFSSSAPKPSFKDPFVFTGNSADVETFMAEIKRAVHLQRSALITDKDKAYFMNSYLGLGVPKQWFQGVEKFTPNLVDDFPKLLDAFKAHFGNPNLAYEYARKLEALRQTNSCSNYAAQFKQLVCYVDWSDQTKIDSFYAGMKSEVKDRMSQITHENRPKTFDAYVKLCIQLDNAAHERELERERERRTKGIISKSFYSNSPTSQSTPTTPSTSDSPSTTSTLSPGIPMEIDATKTSRYRPRLTPEEQKRRRENNLCRYCGGENHYADNCPNMSEWRRKLNEKIKSGASTMSST